MRLILGINDQMLRERIEQKFEKMNYYLASDEAGKVVLNVLFCQD